MDKKEHYIKLTFDNRGVSTKIENLQIPHLLIAIQLIQKALFEQLTQTPGGLSGFNSFLCDKLLDGNVLPDESKSDDLKSLLKKFNLI